MTEKQLLYSINSNKSKALCLRLERLIEDADFHEKQLNIYSREICVYEIWEVKLQLDKIWDIQIDLFFEIQEEYRIYKRSAIMELTRIQHPKMHLRR